MASELLPAHNIGHFPLDRGYLFSANGVVELFLGASGAEAGVAHFAHIGGMLAAIALMVYWSRPRHHSWLD
ncbi:rhomboid family intramembrane serine protease [Paraburkholderia sp. BL23I1N1]|uniref:rhomboid family intramembrane serine protease n=1 Tax=Paraburkholderia sp. BL23I1N1 TaxID=1938802 RepID=UPI000E76EED4